MTTHRKLEQGESVTAHGYDWEAVGGKADPGAHLYGTPLSFRGKSQALTIAGVPMHVNAIAITVEEDIQVPAPASDFTSEDFDRIHAACGADGPWQTLQIEGRAYVLIVEPFCE